MCQAGAQRLDLSMEALVEQLRARGASEGHIRVLEESGALEGMLALCFNARGPLAQALREERLASSLANALRETQGLPSDAAEAMAPVFHQTSRSSQSRRQEIALSLGQALAALEFGSIDLFEDPESGLSPAEGDIQAPALALLDFLPSLARAEILASQQRFLLKAQLEGAGDAFSPHYQEPAASASPKAL